MIITELFQNIVQKHVTSDLLKNTNLQCVLSNINCNKIDFCGIVGQEKECTLLFKSKNYCNRSNEQNIELNHKKNNENDDINEIKFYSELKSNDCGYLKSTTCLKNNKYVFDETEELIDYDTDDDDDENSNNKGELFILSEEDIKIMKLFFTETKTLLHHVSRQIHTRCRS